MKRWASGRKSRAYSRVSGDGACSSRFRGDFPWIELDVSLWTSSPVVALLSIEYCLAFSIREDGVCLHERTSVLYVLGCTPMAEVEEDGIQSIDANALWVPAGVEVIWDFLLLPAIR